jgi:hypothetical protein
MSIFFVSVTPFSGEKADPARPAVYLKSIAGNPIPDRARVTKLEYAQKRGLNVGSSYMISLEAYAGPEGYTNYRISVLKELSLLEILQLQGSSLPVPQPLANPPKEAPAVADNAGEEPSSDLPF